ncbi:EAL domain-containing protein [Polymorphobacter fuscus]|uniref:EAL domain-containing protein n=1 Tax=Sandarakinorhabdus fusca TaxID=1439888 RepID=A0A7C9GVN3_9SPHN|nr:EAL domain-containing protein [Polymorphobacter fuscus]KAB7646419.1 EAL domain-containing protein [Polymorphobacter fuscus]MQT17658.1 EAL domain-containing protein [Polymorphobacter fuscus]NJC09797.1 EAL domain-containing protein (putative c-di-GMP-specific phosphodiesterase class I) [Polymorphobacter fuscus]
MAFQPIVDLALERVHAYEALVRGPDNESAQSVLSKVSEANRYAFDQKCRVAAIEGAVAAGILETDARLSINFLPNAVYSPLACIQLTLATARANDFPTDRLIFEFTENERMPDPRHVAEIVQAYRKMGFATALDDFGAGFAGLSLLAAIQPDIIKLDRQLICGIDASAAKRTIVGNVVRMSGELGVTVIGEGVETPGELAVLRHLGVRYVQGYLLARPAFAAIVPVSFPVAIAPEDPSPELSISVPGIG